MRSRSKRDLIGKGTLTIKNTPGEVEKTFDSKEIINKIDDLKEAILKSRLKYDKYNLIVSKPKDIKKGYRKPLYKDLKTKKIEENTKSNDKVPKLNLKKVKKNEFYRKSLKIKPETIEEYKKSIEHLKKIPAVKPIINKYNNKEKLTEED